jgi:hypothetical protein
MLRRYLGISIFILLLSLSPSSEGEAAQPAAAPVPSPTVCTVDMQLRQPERCQATRQDLQEMASAGLYPQRPLPRAYLDPSLGSLDFIYLRSNSDNGTPLYLSYGDALREQNPYRTVEAGFVFFSYIERGETDGVTIYMIDPGVYIRGNDVTRIYPPPFRGMAFTRTPDMTFAWMLTYMQSSSGPGYDQPYSGLWHYRYEIVQIFETVRIGDLDWYRIGPNEWVEQRMVAKVIPDTNRPEGVPEDRWISINLYEQTLTVYEDGQMVFATLVSSGLSSWWTQPGVFQVYKMVEHGPMSGAFAADRSDYYYLEDVPWSLYYDKARAIHGAYWHNGFGYPRSHGCVNLAPADAQWIYNWAHEGTWVYVFDPTGQTPTDPETYGDGGA